MEAHESFIYFYHFTDALILFVILHHKQQTTRRKWNKSSPLILLAKETWPSFPGPHANCRGGYYQPPHHHGSSETSLYLKATTLWISKSKPRWYIPFYNFPPGTNSGGDIIHQNRHYWLNFGRLGEDLALSWKRHATGSQTHRSLATRNHTYSKWRNGL